MKKYRKKSSQSIIAVQLDLDTEGLSYNKWGDKQFAKRGDWLVNNNGNIYSIDAEAFENTYKAIGPGQYQKVSSIYAQHADEDGCIATLEGKTHFRKGDYLVYEKPGQLKGAYAVSAENFEAMYDLVD